MFADKHEVTLNNKKFNALFNQAEIYNHKVYLLKPQTFMNLSGESLKEAYKFFKIEPQNLIVIHDDLDFQFGTVKIKIGGGPGGHNGLISIIENLGTSDFIRVRMGIGRPTGYTDPAEYVLQPFSEEQDKVLEEFIAQGVEALEVTLKDGVSFAMNKFNQGSKAS